MNYSEEQKCKDCNDSHQTINTLNITMSSHENSHTTIPDAIIASPETHNENTNEPYFNTQDETNTDYSDITIQQTSVMGTLLNNRNSEFTEQTSNTNPDFHHNEVESISDQQSKQTKTKQIQNNKFKGDEWGDKDPNTIRCAFQNINSLQPKSNKKWFQTLRACNDLQLDIIGFAETGINWSMRELRNRYIKDCNHFYSHSKINHSRNKTPCDKTYLPRGNHASVFRQHNWQNRCWTTRH
jgi:hypothetical protein